MYQVSNTSKHFTTRTELYHESKKRIFVGSIVLKYSPAFQWLYQSYRQTGGLNGEVDTITRYPVFVFGCINACKYAIIEVMR